MIKVRLQICFFLLLLSATIFAQELFVDKFTEQLSDLSARTEVRNDLNGTPCALVKIELPLQGVQFNQKSQVIGNVENRVNTYWAYLPAGSKHITLSHPQFHTLDVVFADYGIPYLSSSTTYLLKVNVPSSVAIKKQNTQQYVLFQVLPKNAIVEFDGQQLTLKDGMATVRKPFGTYTYTISADMYHAHTGSIIVNDPVNRHEVNVTLKSASGRLSVLTTESAQGGEVYLNNQKVGTVPFYQEIASGTYIVRVVQPMYTTFEQTITINDDQTTMVTPDLHPLFGYIEVPAEGNLKGGKVYVDNKEVGTVPYKSGRLSQGDYTIRVVKEKYAPVEQTLSVGEGKNTVFRPQLTATFSRVILTTDKGSEIWVNEEKKGVGTWSGELIYGAYLVECKKPNHRTTAKELIIGATSEGETIQLESPIPITGTLDITSTPLDADIYIDDVYKGKTPMFLPDFLIGKHTIKIAKTGYVDYTLPFTLVENEEKPISVSMQNRVTVLFHITPSNAKLYIDDIEYLDFNNVSLAAGEHRITIKHEDYLPHIDTVNFLKDKEQLDFVLESAYKNILFVEKNPISVPYTITIDGQPVEDNRAKIKCGDHKMEISAEGYFTQYERIYIRQDTTCKFQLKPCPIFEPINGSSKKNVSIQDLIQYPIGNRNLSWFDSGSDIKQKVSINNYVSRVDNNNAAFNWTLSLENFSYYYPIAYMSSVNKKETKVTIRWETLSCRTVGQLFASIARDFDMLGIKLISRGFSSPVVTFPTDEHKIYIKERKTEFKTKDNAFFTIANVKVKDIYLNLEEISEDRWIVSLTFIPIEKSNTSTSSSISNTTTIKSAVPSFKSTRETSNSSQSYQSVSISNAGTHGRSASKKSTGVLSSNYGEKVLSRFYNYSGTKFVGILSAGYIYSFSDDTQWLSAGILPFRYKMFGMNLLDIEMSVTPIAEYFIYKPTMHLYFPISKSMALTVYAGACMDLTFPVEKYILKESPTQDFYLGALGGVSLWFNFLSNVPMELFAEYRYPIINNVQEQGFYVGASLLLGVDR